MTASQPAPLRCPRGVAPEDAAAWALDGREHPDLDLAAHLPVCPICTGVVASLAPSDRVAEILRTDPVAAPETVTRRAVGRIRVEAQVVLLAGTLLGAAARVARAAPHYLVRAPRPTRSEGDHRG